MYGGQDKGYIDYPFLHEPLHSWKRST
jgi:hypothetical protein